ncbi:hypothetical protein V2J09_010495 [Rumex salicifolius]
MKIIKPEIAAYFRRVLTLMVWNDVISRVGHYLASLEECDPKGSEPVVLSSLRPKESTQDYMSIIKVPRRAIIGNKKTISVCTKTTTITLSLGVAGYLFLANTMHQLLESNLAGLFAIDSAKAIQARNFSNDSSPLQKTKLGNLHPEAQIYLNPISEPTGLVMI